MSRLNQLAENRVVQMLSSIITDVRELKNRQRVGGNSIRMYLTTTSATTPMLTAYPEGVEPSGDYGLVKIFATNLYSNRIPVRFTSDADFSFADLTYRIFDSGGVELHPGDTNYPFVTRRTQLITAPVAHEKWWLLDVLVGVAGPVELTFQFYVQSTSRGDFRL